MDVAYITQKLVKKIVRHTISVERFVLMDVSWTSSSGYLRGRCAGPCSRQRSLYRGQTQILNTTTLAPLREAQIIEGLGVKPANVISIIIISRHWRRRNQTRCVVQVVVRLVTALWLNRALLPVIPPEDEFPYALRLVSEVLESNGSSSMGSVCGSTCP